MKKGILVACSNGLNQYDVQPLIRQLQNYDIDMSLSPYIYKTEDVRSADALTRANILNDALRNYDYIFDISGGDIANELLEYIDYSHLGKGIFYGYSDLTVLINALYSLGHKQSYLYQVRHQLYAPYALEKLDNISYVSLNSRKMEGIVVGGNIRCFLKLAGTPYFPNMQNKILVLEAYSGDEAKLITYINQLRQIGVFRQINGLLLGNYSEYLKNHSVDDLYKLYQRYIPEDLPVFYTKDIGHHHDAKAIIIGKKYTFMVE